MYFNIIDTMYIIAELCLNLSAVISTYIKEQNISIALERHLVQTPHTYSDDLPKDNVFFWYGTLKLSLDSI